MLISIGAFFEVVFIAITITFLVGRNLNRAMVPMIFVVLIRKIFKVTIGIRNLNFYLAILATVGYYWHENKISESMALGIMISSVVLAMVIIGILVFPHVKNCFARQEGQKNDIEMKSTRSFTSNSNPYAIDDILMHSVWNSISN